MIRAQQMTHFVGNQPSLHVRTPREANGCKKLCQAIYDVNIIWQFLRNTARDARPIARNHHYEIIVTSNSGPN